MSDDPFQGIPTAVPSYSREDWETIRDMLPESERSGELRSYEEFVERVRQMEDDAKRRGAITQRVEIRPEALKVWCEQQNLEINRDSISAYGMWSVAKGKI